MRKSLNPSAYVMKLPTRSKIILQGQTMRIFIYLALLINFAAAPAYAQFQRPQALELSCVHLYPIQMKYLEKHVNFSKLNPNLENRTVEQFIKRLDGSKLYLLDKDVKDLTKLMGKVFDNTKGKDCSALDKANEMFIKRVEERVAYAKKFLGPKFKYDPKAQIQRDPQDRPRPKSMAEANKFHENYMQYQVASYLATDMKLEEAKQQIVRNYERALKRVQEFKKEDLLASYLDSFARALDPHSSYLSDDALQDFEIQMRLSLEGIGATLSSQDGFTVIEQLIPGGAAAGSGKLKNKDRIIAVGQGKDGAFTNVIEMELRDVVKLIRGPKGSEVRLKILRKSTKDPQRFEVTLVRDKIKLEDDAAAITYMDREVNGQKVKVGLLNLPSFYADNRKNGPSASTDMKKLLADAVKNKADAIVLDLSQNGGGSLRDAVDIAGLFFGTGNVVKQSQRVTSELEQVNYETLRDTDATVDWAGPLVVLISRVSASASEIVSGTLQDYKRAVVVGGDHTFGKGTVQSVEYLPPGLGAIKTTVGMFFTAGGESTQHRGVNSDLALPSTYSVDEVGEKTLDYSLPPKKIQEFLSPAAYVSEGKGAWLPLSKDVIKRLKDKSAARVATADGFKKIREDIEKNKKRGKMIIVGDLVKDQEANKDPSKKKKDPEAEGEEDETANLSREERKKKYLERADVLEAVNVAADLAVELKSPTIKVGVKGTSPQEAKAQSVDN
ncbi:MAG: carboxy terminal-processing peptidase [Bdellovibrionales bacterium]|nr:carboxy terminal-processing peptidase [Bdellovibrionales bacterium]